VLPDERVLIASHEIKFLLRSSSTAVFDTFLDFLKNTPGANPTYDHKLQQAL
jgi:hypothetical protein